MQTPKTLLTALVFLFFVTLGIQAAEKMVKCSVSVNGGQAFQVDSIYPNKKAYLEVRALASGMRWRVVDRTNSEAVYLNSKPFSDIKRYQGRTYVGADAVAAAFGYEAKVKQQGLVVDFWSGAGAAAPAASVRVRVTKREKVTSPIPDYETLRLTISIKNSSSQQLRLNAKDFYVSDNRGGKHSCEGNFDIGIAPKGSSTADRLYFNVPIKVTPKKIHVVAPKGEELGSARI